MRISELSKASGVSIPPIARSAVISGRIAAEAARIAWGALIMVGFGVLLGFRFEGGALGVLGAYLLVVAFGLTMCWPMAFLGVATRNPESVNTWGFMIVLPLTSRARSFPPAGSLPGWLEAFVGSIRSRPSSTPPAASCSAAPWPGPWSNR